MQPLLARSVAELADLLPRLRELGPELERVGELLLRCWAGRGKVLVAGNGGSAADAMHFAEELSVRYRKDRRALAAVALCDPAAITCCGNDYGFERVFARQVEALGNPGDVLVALTTSGNSASLLRAAEAARERGVSVVGLLGRGGGALRPLCDLALVVPSDLTPRVQEAHKLLFHVLCEWVDARVD